MKYSAQVGQDISHVALGNTFTARAFLSGLADRTTLARGGARRRDGEIPVKVLAALRNGT